MSDIVDVLNRLEQRLEKVECAIDQLQRDVQTIKDNGQSPEYNEHFYQKKLEKHLGGTHQRTSYGIADIVTADGVYEIKSWKNFKQVVGQLNAYNSELRRKKRCAVFFGSYGQKKKEEVVELLSSQGIEVFEVSFDSGELQFSTVYSKKMEDQLLTWFRKNIFEEPRAVLPLKSVCQAYFNGIVGIKTKSKLRKRVERMIAPHFPHVNGTCVRTTVNGEPFQGWFNLTIKN